MTPEIVIQEAIRSRLVATAGVTNIVSASSILDRNERPAPLPSIIIGEAISRDEGDDLARRRVRVYSDLHVWKKEPSLAGVKDIAGQIRIAVQAGRLELDAGFHCVDCFVASMRFLRDPDGETSHGVVTIESVIEDVA